MGANQQQGYGVKVSRGRFPLAGARLGVFPVGHVSLGQPTAGPHASGPDTTPHGGRHKIYTQREISKITAAVQGRCVSGSQPLGRELAGGRGSRFTSRSESAYGADIDFVGANKIYVLYTFIKNRS